MATKKEKKSGANLRNTTGKHRGYTTIRHKRLLAALPESKTMGEALQKAGYSPESDPKKIMSSEGFLALVNQVLPDDFLLKVHAEGLEATKGLSIQVGRDKKGKPIFGFKEIPDYFARHKYLETAYKIKNKSGMNPQNPRPNVIVPVQINVNEDREEFK